MATPAPAVPPLGACAGSGETRSIVYVSAPEFGIMTDAGPVLAGVDVIAQSAPSVLDPWVVACLTDAQVAALEDRVMVEPDPVQTILDAPALGPEPLAEDLTKLWGLSKINAPTAWQRTEGAGVVVAVIDTGTDCAHEDIGGCVWSVDLAGGPPYHSHGTHVSGTVAARRGNGVGVAGVAPLAGIASCQALDKNGSGFSSIIAQCITESAERGAQVINMSLGGSTSSTAQDTAIRDAIEKGVVVVAAAGNSNSTAPSYPGCTTGVIGVGSTTISDTRSSFSNKGTCVDIAAPGSDILSTTPNNTYSTFSGTSMASPHVAGLAALVLSIGHAPGAVLGVMRDTADAGPSDLGGKRINAGRAVGANPVPVTPAPPVATITPGGPGPAPATPMPGVTPCVFGVVGVEGGQPVLRKVYGPCAQGSAP